MLLISCRKFRLMKSVRVKWKEHVLRLGKGTNLCILLGKPVGRDYFGKLLVVGTNILNRVLKYEACILVNCIKLLQNSVWWRVLLRMVLHICVITIWPAEQLSEERPCSVELVKTRNINTFLVLKMKLAWSSYKQQKTVVLNSNLLKSDGVVQ
jgi:hypothetical protein